MKQQLQLDFLLIVTTSLVDGIRVRIPDGDG